MSNLIKYQWGKYTKKPKKKSAKKQFNKGRNDGQCDHENANEGNYSKPCKHYQLGYITAIHERLLVQNKVSEQDYKDWILIAKLANPRFPLSSSAQYHLVHKNNLNSIEVELEREDGIDSGYWDSEHDFSPEYHHEDESDDDEYDLTENDDNNENIPTEDYQEEEEFVYGGTWDYPGSPYLSEEDDIY
jgi:hypothetical protein